MGKNGFRQIISLNRGYEYLSYLYFTIKRVVELDFMSLLDVGCGDGRLLFELNQTVTGQRLVGIDYSTRAIELAKLNNNTGYDFLHYLGRTAADG
jgi:2-polyprenyl-3-methyl-5-hydroxy-6-metoxy-1,4-benzoquinol methylase